MLRCSTPLTRLSRIDSHPVPFREESQLTLIIYESIPDYKSERVELFRWHLDIAYTYYLKNLELQSYIFLAKNITNHVLLIIFVESSESLDIILHN